MKDILKSRSPNDRGFSLIELVIIVSLMLIIASIAGIYTLPWLDKYNAESQIRQMHTDLMQARVQAMQRNMQSTVGVNTASYTIYFTNDSGATTTPITKTLKFTVYSAGTGTITMDQRGIISAGSPTAEDVLKEIRFDTRAGQPEYDCIQLYATRINIGRWNSAHCVPR